MKFDDYKEMSNHEEILKKAIKKAGQNGWKMASNCRIDDDGNLWVWGGTEQDDLTEINWLLFDHGFAKAFFGEKDMWKETECTCGGVDFHIAGPDAHIDGMDFDGKEKHCAKVKASRGYLFHLKEMVVHEDPIKYLEKFL